MKIEQWDHGRICDSVQGSSAASTTLELPGATVETVAALFLCFSQCKHTTTRQSTCFCHLFSICSPLPGGRSDEVWW